MAVIEHVLAQQFWYSAPMRRQELNKKKKKGAWREKGGVSGSIIDPVREEVGGRARAQCLASPSE